MLRKQRSEGVESELIPRPSFVRSAQAGSGAHPQPAAIAGGLPAQRMFDPDSPPPPRLDSGRKAVAFQVLVWR
jgi:hypothetical protein